jgi:hypothetical protein
MAIIASSAVLFHSYDVVYITDITRYSSHFNFQVHHMTFPKRDMQVDRNICAPLIAINYNRPDEYMIEAIDSLVEVNKEDLSTWVATFTQ